MKEFNLELAKAGAKVQTRDGRPARIICYDVKGLAPILALIDTGDYEFEAYYDVAGRNDNSSLDLFMAPNKKEGWVNLYKDKDDYISSDFFPTEEMALDAQKCYAKFLSTNKVEWEE